MSGLYKLRGFDLQTDRLEAHVHMKCTEKRLEKAHRKLRARIMDSMGPLMPGGPGGGLARMTRAANLAAQDSERFYAAAGVYGRFHYHGRVMVGERSHSPWAGRHERKVVTDRPLVWGNPGAVAFWFDAAKRRDLKSWIDAVKKEMEDK